MSTKSDLVAAVQALDAAGPPDRQLALVLLWAIGRAYRRQPRLTHWSAAERELRELLDAHGRPENHSTPEYPFVALAGSPLWELAGAARTPPQRGVRRWLDTEDPQAGLTESAYTELSTDETVRAQVVRTLLDRFFRGHPAADLLDVAGVPPVRLVPFETNPNHHPTPHRRPTIVERREAALVARYRRWLADRGGASARNEITAPDCAAPQYTDLFDIERQELVEAKGSTDRETVRYALGQLMDYARHVKPEHLAVLLPERPIADLVDLLTTYGVDCVYETEFGQFERESTRDHR